MTGTMGMTWERCGDDGDNTGTTRGQHGATGMTRGQRGPHGDNKITKNAITFEQIEIIEFHLKIWDP